MALHGTLRDFGLADIFQLIGIQRKTGVLTLRCRQETVTVSFLDGQLVHADTMQRRLEERIGALLLKSGKINAAQLDEAMRIQSSTLQRLGTILLTQQMITTADLRQVLQVQVLQIVYELFRWEDGEYHFSQEHSIEYDREVFSPVSAETVLMEGARMVDEWPLIERKLSSRETVFRRAEAVVEQVAVAAGSRRGGAGYEFAAGGGGRATPLALSPEETTVLQLVDGTRTVRDIVDLSHVGDFESCRVLADLLTRKIIEPSGQAEQAKAEDPPIRRLTWGAVCWVLFPALVGLSLLGLPWNPFFPLGGSLFADDVRQPVSRSRLDRIDLALRVFYLEKQALPRHLRGLAAEGVLASDDLLDPWGRPYTYEIEATRYEIAGGGAGGERDPSLVVRCLFPASQRLVVAGGADAPAEASAPQASTGGGRGVPGLPAGPVSQR